jgi:putative ABC transport system permease protein
VVKSVRQVSPELPAREEAYISYRRWTPHETAFVVRTEGRPQDYQAAVLKAIHSVDPEQPVFGMMPMQQLLDNASAARRFSLLLLTLFASIALLLSAIGIYGVMAYTTAQRQHEIGIRLALGALPRDVVRQVVSRGMRLVGIGLGVGLAGAWALSRVLESQLFEISAGDPLTYVGAAILLGLVALAANFVPARRASLANPLASIRTE